MNFKAFSRLILILLGMIMFFLFIWFKFIRERLPKEIPFIISTYGFIFLLYICVIYLVITIIYIRYNKIKAKQIQEAGLDSGEIIHNRIEYIYKYILYYFKKFILFLVTNLFKPLKAFDEALKSIKMFNKVFNKILLKVIFTIQNKREILFERRVKNINTNRSEGFILKLVPKNRVYFATDEQAYRLYYFFIQILPRSILCITFFMDTFYFSCLFYIYKVVYIYIFVLLCKYIAHSARYAKEQYILELETYADCVTLSSRFAWDDFYDDEEGAEDDYDCHIGRSIRRFINIQAHVLVYYGHNGEKIHYDYFFLNKNNMLEPLIRIKSIFLIENALALTIFLDEYEFVSQEYDKIRYIKIVIFFLYFFTWTYILIFNVFWTVILSHLLI